VKPERERIFYYIGGRLAEFIVGVTLAAGCGKILHPEEFALAVYRYHVLPDILVNFVALYISWLEILCAAILLFFSSLRRAALWIVLAMLLISTGMISVAILRGTDFSCGCFNLSQSARPMDWFNVLRNFSLIILTICALIVREKKFSKQFIPALFLNCTEHRQ